MLAALYCGPLSRYRMTAEAIGKPLGLEPVPVPGLISEIDFVDDGSIVKSVSEKWHLKQDIE